MIVSSSSILSAVVFYTLGVVLISVVGLLNKFLGKGGLIALMVAVVFAAARLFLPFELPFTYTIHSWNHLGVAQIYLRENPIVTQRLLVVWVIGAVLVTGWDVLVWCLSRIECKGYIVVKNERVQRIAGQIGVSCPVRVSPDVDVPFVAGIFRHIIYFPDRELDEWTIRTTLSHEAHHVRAHDALIKFFFGVLSALMWWTVWFRGVVDMLLEMRCDAEVTKNMGREEIDRYMEMLKDMTKWVVSHRRVPALSLDEFRAIGRKDTVIARRFRVMNARSSNSSRNMSVLAICMVLLLFLASYLVVFQPAGVPSEEVFQNDYRTSYDEEQSGPRSGQEIDSAFILKGPDGRYQLFVDYVFRKYLSDDEIASEEYRYLHIFEEDIPQ